jgi:hypothetical protein
VADVLTGAALAAELADPEWCEAPVTDAISPLTVATIDSGAAIDIAGALPRLVVGIGEANTPGGDAFDVIVADEAALEPLAAACDRNPTAVIALAQLLRVGHAIPVADALVAESLAYSTLLGGAEFARWRAGQPRREHRGVVEPVGVEHRDRVVTITLQRPEVHNAYDAATRDALVDVLRPLVALPDPPAVVLRGAGPTFSSGGDLSEFGITTDVATAHLIRTARAPGLLLHMVRDHATAVVQGRCVGAGVELPAFCGHVEADRATTFRLPEIAMGLVPGSGGTVSVPRRIGRQRAAWLAITGVELDAETALAWGLVDALG